MDGSIGPSATRSVEVEFLTERGNVSPQNVHILILVTTDVKEVHMKRRNVTNNVVQVKILHAITYYGTVYICV